MWVLAAHQSDYHHLSWRKLSRRRRRRRHRRRACQPGSSSPWLLVGKTGPFAAGKATRPTRRRAPCSAWASRPLRSTRPRTAWRGGRSRCCGPSPCCASIRAHARGRARGHGPCHHRHAGRRPHLPCRRRHCRRRPCQSCCYRYRRWRWRYHHPSQIPSVVSSAGAVGMYYRPTQWPWSCRCRRCHGPAGQRPLHRGADRHGACGMRHPAGSCARRAHPARRARPTRSQRLLPAQVQCCSRGWLHRCALARPE
mmetsp:Transcript_24855/g.62412  ORF Transcript_24855/g.62412 Transcript_24855/m.62412 type:complete len:253 (-) Transcript_24855:197-955(-)